MDIIEDFIKEDDFQDPRPKDEVKGRPGEVSTERETDQEESVDVKEQHIEDDSKGEESYIEERESAVSRFGKVLERALTPRPIETPEADRAFIDGSDIAERIADFARYIATQSIKVVTVPAFSFKVWRHTLGDTDEPQMIAGLQPNRMSLTIRVDSGDTIYIADEVGTCNSTSGYALTGETIEIKANTEVWAVGGAGDEVISLKGEYYK